MRQIYAILTCSLLFGCQTGGQVGNVAGGQDSHGLAVKWFDGSVEQAFLSAKQTQKPIFLYWGAVWCPPCNEIKSQVFSKPRFGELMGSFIPVYLDGDTAQAQQWAEKLQVNGYPTILVLSDSGKEIMRISESVDIEEFELALTAALASKRPFLQTLQNAAVRNSIVSREDWRLLAYFSWYDAKDVDLSTERILALRKAVADKVPTDLVEERALLSAKLLAACSEEDPKKASAPCLTVRKTSGQYLSAMFVDERAILAVRGTINGSLKIFLEWSYPEVSSRKSRELMAKKWIVAASRLQDNASISVDNRLWAVFPELENFKMENPEAKTPPADLVARIVTAVEKADKEATSPFERQSVISGAGYLLGEAGEFERAHAMLTKELNRTTSPWYYHSSLAGLEEKRGDKKAALMWSEKASHSVQGRASKLQWIASDISTSAKLAKDDQQRLANLANQFYQTLFELGDGFSGRNYRSLEKVGKALAAPAKTVSVKKIVKIYAPRCQSVAASDKSKCKKHFQGLLKG